jgi:ABC-2 type transport system permease protein/oleandomycin transport system permease protein
MVVAKRTLLQIPRVPELLVFSTIQPVMFVLLFVYVFGGAIRVPGVDYVDFLMPGIFVQTVAFASGVTAVGLAEDLQKGIIDRFRSLPMARSAVLAGRTTADTVRNAFIVLVMVVVGALVGFRFSGGVAAAVGGLALLLLFALAFSWVGALIGLSVRNAEAANTAGFIWLFPLTFASNAFVPLGALPDWLEAVTRYSPVTVTVAALRGLFLGAGAVATPVTQSLAWSLGITAVCAPLAIARYRRTATR